MDIQDFNNYLVSLSPENREVILAHPLYWKLKDAVKEYENARKHMQAITWDLYHLSREREKIIERNHFTCEYISELFCLSNKSISEIYEPYKTLNISMDTIVSIIENSKLVKFYNLLSPKDQFLLECNYNKRLSAFKLKYKMGYRRMKRRINQITRRFFDFKCQASENNSQ